MQCQLIQNFIDLSGIVGISLLSPPSAPSGSAIHSAGFSQRHSPDQCPFLGQRLQQIVQSTPPSLEFCTFQFGLYQLDLHKADNGAILLVLSEEPRADQYAKAVSELMHFVRLDCGTLMNSIALLNADSAPEPSPSDVSQPFSTVPTDAVLAAMNGVSRIASRYLGPQLVVNHWQASQQPDIEWLSQFRVAADGTLRLEDRPPKLSSDQLAEVRVWIQRFHQRCSRILRDYDTLLEQSLPPYHWQLLFAPLPWPPAHLSPQIRPLPTNTLTRRPS